MVAVEEEEEWNGREKCPPRCPPGGTVTVKQCRAQLPRLIKGKAAAAKWAQAAARHAKQGRSCPDPIHSKRQSACMGSGSGAGKGGAGITGRLGRRASM